jgi:hypothetical protein
MNQETETERSHNLFQECTPNDLRIHLLESHSMGEGEGEEMFSKMAE